MTKAEKREKLSNMIDELGDLEFQIGPYRPAFARCEVLRAAIRASIVDVEPTQGTTLAGGRWEVIAGGQANKSVIDKEELIRLVGLKRIVEVATISVDAIERHFGRQVAGAVISLDPVGARPLTLQAL